eukprot:gene4185-14286_t
MSPSSMILAFALVCTLHVAQGCMPKSWTITKVGDGALGNSPQAYTVEQADEEMHAIGFFSNIYLDPKRASYSCVDSRGGDTGTPCESLACMMMAAAGDDDILETPGGDIAELIGGIVTYHRLIKKTPTQWSIFKKFMQREVTPDRPFYYHTATGNLQSAFKMYANLTGKATPVALPFMGPSDADDTEAWFKALLYPTNQGCGHLKLMMGYPADYGLEESEYMVPAMTIRAYYNYFWWTEMGSIQRSKGPLVGKAVMILANDPDSCQPELFPSAFPSAGGGEMFLYEAGAVGVFRKTVLTDFFYWKSEFTESLNALQGIMLGATLADLAPVNTIPIYQAVVRSA